jgi:hypothetical protein
MKAREVKNLIATGDYKTALRGAKDFRIGTSKEQRSVMARAYECFIRPEFYRSIGKDPAVCIDAGIRTLREVV